MERFKLSSRPLLRLHDDGDGHVAIIKLNSLKMGMGMLQPSSFYIRLIITSVDTKSRRKAVMDPASSRSMYGAYTYI